MVITRDDLPLELRQMNDTIGARRGPVKKLDIPSVRSALGRTGGNKARAARELGVGRATLYRFIRENPEAAEVE
jgi:sigma-54 dependent transcriptional regulator, acetoin dehydrogenase operon transcriptional activator AcoR